MNKCKGVHFYINIDNFNTILLKEENKTDGIAHALHALDTYFTSIERFGKANYNNLVVEKITGARLHLYVKDDIKRAFNIVKIISVYAYELSAFLSKDIPKYNSLDSFLISVGAAYGSFYDFEFKIQDYSELTTIGYAANYAAKLQNLAGNNKLAIDGDIYSSLTIKEKKYYEEFEDYSIKKYGQNSFYFIRLSEVASPNIFTEDEKTIVKEYANSVKLKDVNFTSVRKKVDFKELRKSNCKRLYGIPVFADIRGFTCQFNEDDSNLEEMASKTQKILTLLYETSVKYGGIHVQFQGDRELSLFHNITVSRESVDSEQKCFKIAILASMRMIDAVKGYNIHIGVGEDFGRLFATKIGARGEKDNILLGDTVIAADYMEDKNADEDQIAITEAVYKGLKEEDEYLANQFKRVDSHYETTVGYDCYMRKVSYQQQRDNTARKNYNGAWRCL